MVTIGTLNGGNITVTTGGSSGSTPTTRTATRVWYGDDENVYTDYEIEESISGNYDYYEPTTQIPNVTSAKKIEIGSAITLIGECAFYSCGSLTSIAIPDGVMSIDRVAFCSCVNLANVTIADSVTSIGSGAFADCTALNTITVLGRTTSDAQALLADSGVSLDCTIVGELG